MLNETQCIEKLRMWDNLYYMGIPEVSDTEYDTFRTICYKKFPNNPYFKEDGTTSQKYEEIELPFIMGGLDKVDITSVKDWVQKEKDIQIISAKLDGMSCIISWENKKIIFAASRGDGKTGQNLISKVKYFIPEISINEKVTLRGEILLEGDLYKDLGFKNRRNGVAGLLRRDDVNPNNLKKLSVIFYEVLEPIIETESHRLGFIKNLHLEIPKTQILLQNSINIPETLASLLLKWKQECNYDIDGLVLTSNNKSRENVMYPKSKVKFKVNEEAVKCQVRGLEWNVTRLGAVKPVVIIEPTEIMGVTISRISGFNAAYIEANGIHTGAIVWVVRSGDVIPYITGVFKHSDFNPIPEKCPSCDSKLLRNDVDIICFNGSCKQRNIYTVSHFFKEMGTDNISDRTIEMLGIYSIEEAYQLNVDEIEKIPGFGRKKANIIHDEITKTLTTKPERVLAGFGMGLIGSTLSKSLMSKFTLEELFEIKDPELIGLGPITSKALIDNIGNYKKLYDFLIKQGMKFIEEDLSLKTLKGMKFTLTGAGPLKRKEYEKMAEDKGAEVKSISKDTNYLVTDDVTSDSSKIKAAKKFGTPIITYEKFMEMLK